MHSIQIFSLQLSKFNNRVSLILGFFSAVFGGTKSKISGPTAPMAIAMAAVITVYSSTLTEALTVVVLAGLFQVVLGVSKIGRFVAYTPYVVVSGFMSGIGIIIMLIQIRPFLGLPPAFGGAMGALKAMPETLANINISAMIIAAVTLVFAVFWPTRLHRRLPAPLVALIVGTLLGGSVAERRSGHRTGPNGSAIAADWTASPRFLDQSDRTRTDFCSARFYKQPLDFLSRRFTDRHPT